MEDFLDVYDELDENISMYDDRQADLRKAMKIVLQADGEFHARLEGLQHNLTAEERKDCDFVLNSIVEAVTIGTAEHKKMQAEQEVSARNKKKK
jgi:DNA repair exonuclease SbcCD ATPase subunit